MTLKVINIITKIIDDLKQLKCDWESRLLKNAIRILDEAIQSTIKHVKDCDENEIRYRFIIQF